MKDRTGRKMDPQKIPSTNEISAYLHCAKCLEEMPKGTAPRDWARVQAGFTPLGIQVWCNRHECNIVHINFEGLQHPANTDRLNSTSSTIQTN